MQKYSKKSKTNNNNFINNSINSNSNVTSGTNSIPDTNNTPASTSASSNYSLNNAIYTCDSNGSNNRNESGSNSTSTIIFGGLSADTFDTKQDQILGYDDDDDDERIDYSNALLKENKNCQEILSKVNAVNEKLNFNKVYTGFAENLTDAGFNQMDRKTQNQLVFDVLPSFEMYRSFQFSSPVESLARSHEEDFPPDYFNHMDAPSYAVSTIGSESIITPGESFSLLSSTTSINLDSDSSYPSVPAASTTTTASSYSVSAASASASASTTASTTASTVPPTPLRAEPIPDVDQEIERSIIDKSHTLQNLNSFDIEVEVHVTKDVPSPTKQSEKESFLKEYTSGDVVHGYVVVHNTSDDPIPFQMFHVTLEGYISIINKDKKKQILKRFLTMVDLSASWSHGCISPSSNISFEAHSKDNDGCILGLRNDRILEPHTKYKKFFTFKFPYHLLDNVCRHQLETHTLLPPSFGVDTVKKRGKYADIEINPVTNYGHLGTQGSPILTKDLSQPNLSVSYGINAKLIVISPKDTSKFCILKDHEYSLRFIPYGFTVPLFSSKMNLTSLCNIIDEHFKTAERVLKSKIEGKEDYKDLDLDTKTRQLNTSSNSSHYGDQNFKFPLSNKSFGNPDSSKVETRLNYLMNGLSTKSSFLNKLKGQKKISSTDFTKSGLITLSTKIPKDGLPYRSPALLRQTNEISNLSKAALKNYDSLCSSLSTNEKQKLSSLKLELHFSPSDHSLDLAPPEIRSIKPSLVVLNIVSSSSVPIKLSPDLFETNDFSKLKAKFEKYHDTFLEIESKFQSSSIDISNYLDNSVLQDIKAMKDLQVEKFSLGVFDHSMEKSEWESNGDSANGWERTIDLSLNFKEDISETLIPNFQSCLLSRVYVINVDVSFKNGQSCELIVPIRIRKFDDF